MSARRWALIGLAGTAALGLLLRLTFAGVSGLPLTGHPAWLRHAHSHLGYYAFVFPALWLAWRGGWRPSGPTLHVYAATSFATCGAFALQGYAAPSIVGSTLVGAVWAVFAWRLGPLRWLRGDWQDAAAPAVLLALCLVPPVAVLTRRDPVLAAGLVRTFLTLLLVGATLPALVGRASVPGALWLPAATLAAVGGGLGLAWSRLLGYGAAAVLLAVGILRASPREGGGRRDRLMAAQWWAVAAGFGAYALGLFPSSHFASIAGVHFIALGPVATSTALRGRARGSTGWLYVGLVAAMSSAIVLMGASTFDPRALQAVAAATGAGILAFAIWWAVRG